MLLQGNKETSRLREGENNTIGNHCEGNKRERGLDEESDEGRKTAMGPIGENNSHGGNKKARQETRIKLVI